ncbi:MAG: hypothetical protein ACI841_000737 [Planctomycetota bacterium]|jgi:hypothetical protein
MNTKSLRFTWHVASIAVLLTLSSACRIYIGDDGMSMRSWRSGDGSGFFEKGPVFHGDGVAANEERVLESFDAISIRGGFELDARIGETQSIVIHADSNILERIETEVEDGVLEIGLASGNYHSIQTLKVVVTVPRLRSLDVRGSVDGSVRGLDVDSFAIDVSGAADLHCDGRVRDLDIDIRGSGELALFELTATKVEVSISGSGSVRTHAEERIDARISGSGSIRYRGQPATHISVSGSGVIQAAD